MKIDSNSSGAIGFDDFTSYILLQQVCPQWRSLFVYMRYSFVYLDSGG
jgi:hypothetical protein